MASLSVKHLGYTQNLVLAGIFSVMNNILLPIVSDHQIRQKAHVKEIVNLVTEDGHSDLPTGVCVGMFGPMHKTYPQNIPYSIQQLAGWGKRTMTTVLLHIWI